MADRRVAGYLGRMLDGDGEAVGTCFQVAPGVLATAWHVLDEIGAADEGAAVRVDPLAGGAAFGARVRRLDPVHDLAVMVADAALPTTAGSLADTDRVPPRTQVTSTGHVQVEDAGHTYRFLNAPGTWAGSTTRDDAVPLGCMTTDRVMPGMSGAPVVRDRDGVVVGVVSGRYNTADGWLAANVWVARTEDLVPLLDGIAEVALEEVAAAEAVDLVFTVTSEQVRLTGFGVDVSAAHGGVRPGLVEAVEEIRRSRTRAGLIGRGQAGAEVSAGELALGRAGRLLAESFLPEPVAGELKRVLRAASGGHVPVRIGIVVSGELALLPWECLADPYDHRPLALHPLVNVYRRVPATKPREVPGPLRIVVAIAAPDTGGSGVLDYERELRNVIAAVRSARQGAADVRVVPFASPAAIYAALDAAPAHVLHISGHGGPGLLELEQADGTARRVTAEEFMDEAIPPGKMPPVIALAACYTDAAATGEEASFAARLCQRGTAVVIATETSVTDRYATRLFARVYGRLAQAGVPDAVAALADARREVQRELAASTDERERNLAALDEWAVVTVLAASGSVCVFDPHITAAVPPPPPRPQIAGLVGRDTGYFVGRRREQRRWPQELVSSPTAGLVIHGIGGVGKTTLAAEIVGRVLAEQIDRVLVTLTGPLTLEGMLGAVTSALRRVLLIQDQANGEAMQTVTLAGRADLGWEDRLALLREHLLDRVPLLVVLDNFEDNLNPPDTGYADAGHDAGHGDAGDADAGHAEAGYNTGHGEAGYTVRDEVLAGLLAAWIASPGRSRVLITSRFAFSLPGGAERALAFHPIGPLSLAETMKLAWSLPALDHLDETQLSRVWRLVGGHPRSLEYLDALLSGGTARYPDVSARLTEAVGGRLGETSMQEWLAARTGLDAALAEVVSIAADDVLLDELLGRLRQLPGAESLLLGTLVYREPVDANALLFQVGEADEAAANVPDRAGAQERIAQILADAGIAVESFDLGAVPADVQALLAPHLAELRRPPTPPFLPPAGMPQLIRTCQAVSLLIVDDGGQEPGYFVHRWTATELAQRAMRDNDPRLAQAHRAAARYWQWRVEVWPQDGAADLHDLLEARHHLLEAGELEDVVQLSEAICSQLHTRGAWDEESSLIHDTIARLPDDSPRHSAWIHQLGIIAQERGDYPEAERQYRRSLDINEHLGNQAGLAGSYHQLGILAQLRGDYPEAERQYRRALDINEHLGNQAGLATSYHNLGMLSQLRGDYPEAERQYRRSLDINEHLGNQAGMATSYSQLGILEADRGGVGAAIAWHVKALAIRLRLGIPEIRIDLHHLAKHRVALGDGRFTALLTEATGDAEQAKGIMSLLDQADGAAAGDGES